MVIKGSAEAEQKDREQSPCHTAAGTGDTEQIIKRTVIKEKQAECEQEQIEAFAHDGMFLNPFFHMLAYAVCVYTGLGLLPAYWLQNQNVDETGSSVARKYHSIETDK